MRWQTLSGSPVPTSTDYSGKSGNRAGPKGCYRLPQVDRGFAEGAVPSALVLPAIGQEINQRRKRIDLAYTNVASEGFFHWLIFHHGVFAPRVFAECKNYTREVGNTEVDQLAGRLTRDRGQFGMLVCRRIDDRSTFNLRCRDAVRQGHYMIGVDDDDLRRLVRARKSADPLDFFRAVKDLFDPLVM